ncbi:MAG: hypothetical protein MZV65_26915 [Chromatiales bacterium]|nr:hypothetical protein [Chromatiales bacterium]
MMAQSQSAPNLTTTSDPALALELVGGDGSRCVEVFAHVETLAERLLRRMNGASRPDST